MLVAPLLLGFAVCSGSLLPCTCIPRPLTTRSTVAATVRAYSAVFEGTVVRTAFRDDSVTVGTDSSHVRRVYTRPSVEVTLAVGPRWKGVLSDTVTVRTPAGSAACGANFAAGRSYLVFASSWDDGGIALRPARPGEVVYTTRCSPTVVVGSESQRIATLLGQPLPPRAAAGRRNVPEA